MGSAPSDGEPEVPWRQRLSLRLRIAMVAALVVTGVVSLGGVAILLTIRAELVSAADDAVTARAEEVAALVADGTAPAPIPTMLDPETFAEVVADGRVVAATEGLGDGSRFDLPTRRPGDAGVVGVD